MSLEVGIVGLPNVGKSTLFNALLKRQIAEVSEYPFCTIEPNVGVVEVEDERLEKLAKVVGGEMKVVPAAIKFVDIAGLVKNAHKGEGLGNEFLSHIRAVDAILHLLRLFENPQIAHVTGKINPIGDVEIVNTELILKDLEVVEKGEEQLRSVEQRTKSKKAKGQPDGQKEKKEVLRRVKEVLNNGKKAVEVGLSEDEMDLIRDLGLLTLKPLLYVLNVSENQLREKLEIEGQKTIPVCAKLEAELSELSSTEQKEYLAILGQEESALDRVIKKCYQLLDLITFFTIAGGKIVQAWPLKRESTVLEAAQMIHSDFAEKFVKAEVVSCRELIDLGSWAQAQSQGKVKVVGRECQVEEGDVITIKI